jgi:hypothetical protein
MDGMHIKVAESWGADGVLHFDPAWGARTEGLMDGYLAKRGGWHARHLRQPRVDQAIKSLDAATLWTVRAHRGLNTPEIAVMAGFAGADLTKINIGYGSLNGALTPRA